jgi:hypothetical protein
LFWDCRLRRLPRKLDLPKAFHPNVEGFEGIFQIEQTHDHNSKAEYGQAIALLLYINSQVKTLLYEK